MIWYASSIEWCNGEHSAKAKAVGSTPQRCERLPKSLLLKVITISEEQFEPANEMEDLTVQGAISKVITYL